MSDRKITIYRDDSTTQVVYERVKHIFWTAGNSVLVIAQYDEHDEDFKGIKRAVVKVGSHHYIHWPRERICWFKDEPQ